MSGLDPIGRREVRDLIAALRTTGTTVFFCSHILADIEVLCDRAAILQRGTLAHIGRLADLRMAAGGTRAMEVVVSTASANLAGLKSEVEKLSGARLLPTPGGARLEVASERDVDAALSAVRASGATLVSVQPVGNPLEELFTSDI
jgi:ABC-2 type transport system ATP-binding protein